MEFSEEYVSCLEKHVFCLKNLYEWVKHGSKRQSTKWNHTDFPVKKKFWAQLSLKKVMLTVFWEMKGLMIIDFLEKGATLNSVLQLPIPYLLNDLCSSGIQHKMFCISKIYRNKVMLVTVVEGSPKAPFSIATTTRFREDAAPFSGLLHFTLDPYFIMLSVKQEGNKYDFLSLWHWIPVSQAMITNIHWIAHFEGARGIMVIVVGNGHNDTSSNPGPG